MLQLAELLVAEVAQMGLAEVAAAEAFAVDHAAARKLTQMELVAVKQLNQFPRPSRPHGTRFRARTKKMRQ